MLLATGAVILFIYLAIWFTEWYQKEPVVRYEIVTPTRQIERKILEQPSIKVRASGF